MSFYYGVAYYPEVWDKSNIDNDILKMKEIGLNTVRIGEFAWSTVEKEEGKFDFSLFEYVIDKMNEAGIGVILCTPSCTPPKWLTDKYPEILIVNDAGIKRQFGARCHACKTNLRMREKTSVVVEKMCQSLANKPNVIGWQIDNEIYPYEDGCFCESCKKAFIGFMSKKYKAVENLNKEWGNARWSLDYPSFESIIPPRKDTWNHPSLQADWLSFQSEQIIDFVSFQAEIIRKYSDKPIGTDMMTACAVSHVGMNKKLDVVQINHYERERDFFNQAFWFDYVRTVKNNPFWCTETQTCWNGAFQADFGEKQISNCYANTVMPFFKGGEMNLYWLWRTHPVGQELMHGAILDCTGREYYTTGQVLKAIKDVSNCEKILKDNPIRSDIALHFSTNSFTQLSYVPVVEGFKYQQAMYNIYRGFMQTNLDIIDENHTIDQYKVVISPFLTYIDKGLEEKIKEFVKNGGVWIVGPMSNIFNNCLKKHTDLPLGFIEEMAGVYLKYNIPVNHHDYSAKWNNGLKLTVSDYYDAFICKTAKPLAVYCHGDLKGYAVITCNNYGKGKVIAVGSVVGGKDYYALTGIKPYFDCSDNIIVNKRKDLDGCEYYSLIESFGRVGRVKLKNKYLNIIDGKEYKGNIKVNPFEAYLFKKI